MACLLNLNVTARTLTPLDLKMKLLQLLAMNGQEVPCINEQLFPGNSAVIHLIFGETLAAIQFILRYTENSKQPAQSIIYRLKFFIQSCSYTTQTVLFCCNTNI
jgi:hypothetical protein